MDLFPIALEQRTSWQDHTLWTRAFMIAFFSKAADLSATQERLLANQVHLGQAIGFSLHDPAYGQAVTKLLTEHILQAVVVLSTAQIALGLRPPVDAGLRLEQAKQVWYANGRQIAQALSKRLVSLVDWEQQLRVHLDTTIAEAVALLQRRYPDSVREYDIVQEHMLNFANLLSEAIVETNKQGMTCTECGGLRV